MAAAWATIKYHCWMIDHEANLPLVSFLKPGQYLRMSTEA